MSKRRRLLASVPITTALALGSLLAAGSALAAGTCEGNAAEYVLPADTQDATLTGYDLNHDGVICVAARGKKTAYSDNRP